MQITKAAPRWRPQNASHHNLLYRERINQYSFRSGQRAPTFRISSHSYEPHLGLDADFVEAMDDVLSETGRVEWNEADPKEIDALHEEFASTRTFLMEESDVRSAQFMEVLQGLLRHTVIDRVSDLKEPYLRAYKRLYNALQALNWELNPECQHRKTQRPGANRSGPPRAVAVSAKRQSFYELLGISASAGKDEIKSAYRKLALKWHPDVNLDEDTSATFLQIRKAYDVLSNPTSRKLYDTYGEEEMENKSGAHAGDGNADRFWNEFKPFKKKESRKTKARNAGLERMDEDEETTEPMAGDVVEYPLSDMVQADLQDGRVKGVGLLVGRNKDRGDAAKLPPELLGMCEIEPLRQDAADSNRWIPDEIGCSAFCELEYLKKVPVTSYDGRFDTWVIDSELSDGCGGPEIVEEIML